MLPTGEACGVHWISELRTTPIDRKFGAGREGRVEREEEDGLRDLLRGPEALHRDRKSTRLNSSHLKLSRMPSSA